MKEKWKKRLIVDCFCFGVPTAIDLDQPRHKMIDLDRPRYVEFTAPYMERSKRGTAINNFIEAGGRDRCGPSTVEDSHTSAGPQLHRPPVAESQCKKSTVFNFLKMIATE